MRPIPHALVLAIFSFPALAQNAPMQLTPQTVPQTKAAPNATPAPSFARPSAPAAEPERRGILHRPSPFSPAQRATLEKISSVYNGIKSMSGTFAQAESDGSRATGKFFITKPGRVRFLYDAPATLDIVADGQQLAVRDKKLGTQDIYQLWQTPLRYLLKERINLIEDARIVSVLQDQNVVTVSIEEEGALTQGRLTLYFSSEDYSLQQWTTLDANGASTTVTVSNIETNKPNAPNLFNL